MRYPLLFIFAISILACTSQKPAPISSLPSPVPVISGTSEPSSKDEFEFIILQLNDVYEISPLKNGRGGMARVSSLRNQLLGMNPNVLTILSGDYLSPSLIGSLKCDFGGTKETVAGRHMVEVMNATGIDYVTYGNHEFDLKEMENIARTQESKFKIISSNVLHQPKGGSSKLFQQNGVDVPGHAIHTFHLANGGSFRLGLIGVTIDATKTDYVGYTDPYSSVDKTLAYIKSTNAADLVFGITHLTMDMDDTLAQKVPGMPLLFGGHEHVNMTRKVGNTTIFKADANAKTVWIHFCKYNTRTQTLRTDHLLFPITDALPADPNVEMLTRKWERFANECMSSQGYAPFDTIGFYLKPLDGREETVRFGQTNLGTLLTDAIRLADPGVQCAMMNSGTIRLDDVLQGFVTQRDVIATLPFGGDIQKGSMPGANLRRLLDAGLDESMKGNGGYLQVSNISLKEGKYYVNGQPLADEQSYMVAMPGYLASGREKALPFVKDLAAFSGIQPQGGMKNDFRDIVIWHMRRTGNLSMAKQLLDRQR
jgi:2',3'-cyclic-nucleotide 2'-phosphodiesterase (5'-nucleotidase family)